MKAIIGLLVALGLVGACSVYYIVYIMNAEPPTIFRTAPIELGDMIPTISATGTLEPEDLIDVGAQVAGRIISRGKDPHNPNKDVDYTTVVEEGTLLAKIDPTLYQAQVDQTAASLAHAKADLLQLQARCDQTEQEWKRAQKLLPQKAIADTDYDLALANYLVAKANMEVGKATIQQCEAALSMAKTNLDYTVIKSPVRGVVIDRRVNVGQTVVAALNAPSLFLLAKDLRKMEIWSSVNEADIGRIHEGLPVRFTIDTYPGETFEGKVTQIRLNATTTQNIVTYTVVVTTDNPPTPDKPNGKLLPYMTANVKFEIDRHSNVLMAPNIALRWKPRPSQIAPDARETASVKARASGSGKADPPAANPSNASAAKMERQEPKRVWVKDGDYVRPVAVQVGPTDGSMTEIKGEGVEPGMRVIIGESRTGGLADDSDATTNPFLPKIRPGGAPKAKQ